MKAVLKRFLEVWKPDFLQKISQSDNQKTTWFFWFFYNSIAALIISIFIIFTVAGVLNRGMEYFEKNYPDAKISLENGKLSTEGLREPILWAEEGTAFVLDTKNEKYDVSILDKYEKGYFIGSDKIYNKGENSSIETKIYDLSKTNKNFSITEKELHKKLQENLGKIYLLVFILTLVLMIIFLAGFKLVSAFLWALIFWGLALLVGIKKMTFKETYYGVLNFYFIVLIFQVIMSFANIDFPFSTTLIFLLLFALNFRKLKEFSTPLAPAEQESKIEEETKEKNEEKK
jgi:hypothetical protein